jgi:hypothetical protein
VECYLKHTHTHIHTYTYTHTHTHTHTHKHTLTHRQTFKYICSCSYTYSYTLLFIRCGFYFFHLLTSFPPPTCFHSSGLLYSFLIILDGLRIPPTTIRSKTLDPEAPDSAQNSATKNDAMSDNTRIEDKIENGSEKMTVNLRMIARSILKSKSTNPFASDADVDAGSDADTTSRTLPIVRSDNNRKNNHGYMPLMFPTQERSQASSIAYEAGRGTFSSIPKSSTASSNPFDTPDDDEDNDDNDVCKKELERDVGKDLEEVEVTLGLISGLNEVRGEDNRVADQRGEINRTLPATENEERGNDVLKAVDEEDVKFQYPKDQQQMASKIATTSPPSHHSPPSVPVTNSQPSVSTESRNSTTHTQGPSLVQKPYNTEVLKVRNPLVEKVLARHHPFSPQYYEFIGPKFFFFFVSCSCVTLFWVLQFPQVFHFPSRGRGVENDEKCVKMLSVIFGMLIAACTGTWLSLIVKVSSQMLALCTIVCTSCTCCWGRVVLSGRDVHFAA